MQMLRSVYTKSIWDHRRSTGWWIIGSAAIITWVSFVYPVLRDSEEMKGFVEDLPSGMLAVFGIDPATYLTGAGFLQAQFFSLFGPLMIIGLGISLAVGATAKEEKDGTMDMLLSVPISRASLITQKALMVTTIVALVASTVAATMLILNVVIDLGLSIEGVVAVNVSLALLGLIFGGVTLAVGAFSGKPSTAIGIGILVAAVAWLVNAFANLFDWLEIPSKLSPFTWYLEGSPLINGWTVAQVWMVVAVLVLVAAAMALFNRRNISTDRSVVPAISIDSRARRPQKSRAPWLLHNVFGKSIWDRRRSVWLWAAGLVTLLLLTFAAWPTFAKDSAAISDMISAMPKELFAMFGMTDPDSLATPAGFISSRTYQSVGPIVIMIFAIGSVSGLIGKEESKGQLDMVLSNPVSRQTVLVEKAGAIALLTVLIGLVLAGFGLIGNVVWGTGLELTNILAANTGLVLLGLCFGGIAMAVWSVFGSGAAIGVSVAIGGVAWFLNGLGAIVDGLAPFRMLSPFYWYLGNTAPLAKGFEAQYLLLVLVAIVGAAFATWRFDSSDLAV
jgi:ABC-2 type transport system permease protein